MGHQVDTCLKVCKGLRSDLEQDGDDSICHQISSSHALPLQDYMGHLLSLLWPACQVNTLFRSVANIYSSHMNGRV